MLPWPLTWIIWVFSGNMTNFLWCCHFALLKSVTLYQGTQKLCKAVLVWAGQSIPLLIFQWLTLGRFDGIHGTQYKLILNKKWYSWEWEQTFKIYLHAAVKACLLVPTRKCPSSENSIIYSSPVLLRYSGADSARRLDVYNSVHGSDLKKAWGALTEDDCDQGRL